MSRLVNLWKIVLNEILSIWYEKRCSLCWKTGSLRIYIKEAEKCLLRPVFNWISFPQWLLTRSRKKKEENIIFSLISSPHWLFARSRKRKTFSRRRGKHFEKKTHVKDNHVWYWDISRKDLESKALSRFKTLGSKHKSSRLNRFLIKTASKPLKSSVFCKQKISAWIINIIIIEWISNNQYNNIFEWISNTDQ